MTDCLVYLVFVSWQLNIWKFLYLMLYSCIASSSSGHHSKNKLNQLIQARLQAYARYTMRTFKFSKQVFFRKQILYDFFFMTVTS